MTNTATLSGLATQALDLADLTSSTSPVTARVYEYVNSALSELHDLLVCSFEQYLMSRTTVTLVSGTDYYSLPGDFLKSVKVYLLSNGDRYRLRRFELDEYEREEDETGLFAVDNVDLRYRILGSQIWFSPTPSAAGTVDLWYVPQFTPLTTSVPGTSDVIHVSVPVGWEEFVVLSAAAKLKIREESDASQLLMLKEQARQRIISAAGERDSGEPSRVSDTYGRWR